MAHAVSVPSKRQSTMIFVSISTSKKYKHVPLRIFTSCRLISKLPFFKIRDPIVSSGQHFISVPGSSVFNPICDSMMCLKFSCGVVSKMHEQTKSIKTRGIRRNIAFTILIISIPLLSNVIIECWVVHPVLRVVPYICTITYQNRRWYRDNICEKVKINRTRIKPIIMQFRSCISP